METMHHTAITVTTTVNAPIETVWNCWTKPEHITQWCQASDDWHAPHAENDLRVNGKFKTTMAAKDGSYSFDFGGTYTHVEHPTVIAYRMDDGRRAHISFIPEGASTKVVETFEIEDENPGEMQRGGWQAILDNFKKHAEVN